MHRTYRSMGVHLPLLRSSRAICAATSLRSACSAVQMAMCKAGLPSHLADALAPASSRMSAQSRRPGASVAAGSEQLTIWQRLHDCGSCMLYDPSDPLANPEMYRPLTAALQLRMQHQDTLYNTMHALAAWAHGSHMHTAGKLSWSFARNPAGLLAV